MAANKNGAQKFVSTLLVVGGIFGLWAGASLLIGLSQANWQVSEMLRQYLVAVGAIKEFETLVDFYTHIKGIEYILCVAFLGAFPVFYKYLNTTKAPAATR